MPTVKRTGILGGFRELAKEVGAGKRKRILLVVDKAGWHTAKNNLEVPEGIHLEFLPSHSPDSNPQRGCGL